MRCRNMLLFGAIIIPNVVGIVIVPVERSASDTVADVSATGDEKAKWFISNLSGALSNLQHASMAPVPLAVVLLDGEDLVANFP